MQVADNASIPSAVMLIREARLKLERLGLKDADTPEHLFDLRRKLESSFAEYQESNTEKAWHIFAGVVEEVDRQFAKSGVVGL
jgi:hypothetical protein